MRSARGCIRRRGLNRWWVSKPGPIDENGKRTEVGVAVRGSRVDAAVALAQLLGDALPDTTTWEAFYNGVVEPTFSKLSERTAADYRRLWEVELRYRIGGELVSALTWKRANEVLTDVSAPSVQRYCGRFLKKMCNMAIRSGLLQSNPVDRAIEYAPLEHRRKRLVLSHEVASFMESIEGVKYEPMLLLELGAGLRPEEARALLWEDLSAYELKGSVYCAVNVDKALTSLNGKGHFKSTKNESSARTAVCGEPFASRILALSDGKSGPLCPSGKPYDPNSPEVWYTSPQTISHNWRHWCKRRGVPHVTDENLRSSYATMMGEALVPDSIVSGNMGHADGTTKGKHYQSVTMRAKCLAADMLADSLADFGPQRSASGEASADSD